MFIEGKNLVKKYGKGEATVFALDHAEFGIEKGEIVVILGPSGSGKSTLLNILGGLDKVTEGSMLVDGTDLEKMFPFHPCLSPDHRLWRVCDPVRLSCT